eukprot:SAG31_NODE_1017_length_10360_cov_35.198811_12_plen_46_part_00
MKAAVEPVRKPIRKKMDQPMMAFWRVSHFDIWSCSRSKILLSQGS